MKLKKLIIIALSLTLLFSMTSCGKMNNIDENKPTVVCTGFAQYDWVLNILGDEAENWNVVRLNDKGADMHSYQPSAEDMIVLNKSDLIIYNGGTSEEWIEEAIETQEYQGTAYALLENGEPICLEDDHHHDDHDHDEDDHHGHSHDEYDEHIWLSLDNAMCFCEDIAGLLDEILPSEVYAENCQNYLQELKELKREFEHEFGLAEECNEEHNHEHEHEADDHSTHDHDNEADTIIFADRFPFRYLARDYDLNWYAAFPGCSAETEASFETIKELADKVEELDVHAVLVTETGDDSLAKTVIANSGKDDIQIIRVNSMQSVPSSETRGYIEIMHDNLEALKIALG